MIVKALKEHRGSFGCNQVVRNVQVKQSGVSLQHLRQNPETFVFKLVLAKVEPTKRILTLADDLAYYYD